MTRDFVQTLLVRCLLVNYGILLLWFVVFWFGHDRMFRLHGRWFQMSKERFDSIHYACMAGYKSGILLNLAPCVALRWLGLHAG